MIHCSNCQQENPERDLFCRRCGSPLHSLPERPEQGRDFDRSPPRPYSWSTGEFKPKRRGARTTRQIDLEVPVDDPFQTSRLPATAGNGQLNAVYRCPHCGTTAPPITEKKVSSAGWAVFTLLLIFTLFLFWIGLLMQEEVYVCPICRRRVG